MIDAVIDAMIDPLPPFTFCRPQAMRTFWLRWTPGYARQSITTQLSYDSKQISLLPLDDVPVHVHRFAARAPCDSKGSECQCGIHRAETASALRSRKTERAAKEKPTPISQIFF